MTDERLAFASLLNELRDRRVFRTVLIYIAAAWLVIQAVDIIGPALFLPAWSTTLVVVMLVLGLPFAVLLAWRFDIVGGEATRQASPEGKAATYIWLAFSVITFIGGSWLAYYSYSQTMAIEESVHASFGVYSPPQYSVAVLPFTNMSGNPENDYFGEGLADSVLHKLAQVEQLFVIARTSSFRFKGSEEGIESIGRKLNVGAVLEGSVQQAGNQMRIIAQLIDVRTGQHLQSLTFDSSADDVFAVQDEISVRVAEALEIELLQGVTDKLTASGTDVPKAHDLYMLGRFHAGKYTPEGVRRGHEFFKQAIALDPTFVLAYVGVADTLIRSPQFEQVPGTALVGKYNQFSQEVFPGLDDDERYSQAKEALDTALVLDDSSPEAYTTLGYLETWLGDRAVAEALFKKAIELAPGLVDAHYMYGRFLAEEFRYSEARESLDRALELDPVNIPVIVWNSIYRRTDFEQMQNSTDLISRVAELDPENRFSEFRNPSISFVAYSLNADIGHYDRAVEWIESELGSNAELPINVMTIGSVYFDLGEPEVGESWRALAVQSPQLLYTDHNGLSLDWFLLLRQERYEEIYALLNAIFDDREDPGFKYYRAMTRALDGDYQGAIADLDTIPAPILDAILYSHEDVISNLPAYAFGYAWVLHQVGLRDRMEEVLLRIEALVTFFREEGYSLAALDLMEAQIYSLRDDHDAAIASMLKTVGKLNRWPLDWDPALAELRDDPRFQEILATNQSLLEPQLELVRERHRVPPPWSPDYTAQE